MEQQEVYCICGYDARTNERDHNSECPAHNKVEIKQPADDVVEQMFHRFFSTGGRQYRYCKADQEDLKQLWAAALAVAREGYVPVSEYDRLKSQKDALLAEESQRIKDEFFQHYESTIASLKQQLATMYSAEQVEEAIRAEMPSEFTDLGIDTFVASILARLAAPKQEQERVTIRLEKWADNEHRYTIYVDGKPYLAGFPTEEEAKRYITLMGGVGIPKQETTAQKKVIAILKSWADENDLDGTNERSIKDIAIEIIAVLKGEQK